MQTRQSGSLNTTSLVFGRLLLGTLLPIGIAGMPLPAAGDCGVTSNPIVCENAKPGAPFSEWGIAGYGDTGILGFTTDVSYNRGETARFKIKTTSTAYQIDIYRTGYYSNLGARHVTSILPSVPLPQVQPRSSA